MNAEPRTAVVKVLVTKTLEVDEPVWCTDPHDRAQFKPDITHNGPEIAASVETGIGTAQYLRAWLTQAPYGILAPEPQPLIAVDLGGYIASFDPDMLRNFTASARIHLAQLDALADTVEDLRGGGQ
ncbi:hypothetical protein ABZS88_11340 [Streptomyces sp. NPDC005480]|uniref:DUF6907 domain-containing protein n=1 Tax=Streptomyces sp. NPDC005480 TaxID=3154880 RepID=UPI0033A3E70F